MKQLWSRAFVFASVVVVISTFAAACGGSESGSRNPASPSGVAATEDGGETAGASNPSSIIIDSPEPVPLPETSGPSAVTFPPRNEALLFRTALEAKYRDGLRRSAGQSFVDQEGTVVWVQEYLRYRVNLCPHSDAVLRVLMQIDGFGIQPVCGVTNTATFPARQQPLDFMVQLEAKYRDGLRRASSASFVDVEGNVIWTQEYYRYRVSTCDHFSSQQKVFDQIDGRGIAADCTRVTPPPPPPPTGFTLTVVSNQCQCVVGPIQVRANGNIVGQMSCPQTALFSVPSGASVTICDLTGCFGTGFVQTSSRSVNLTCGAGAINPQTDPFFAGGPAEFRKQ